MVKHGLKCEMKFLAKIAVTKVYALLHQTTKLSGSV